MSQLQHPETPSTSKAEPLSDAQLASACLSYRHDFGLLEPEERVQLMAEAREWDRALRKERERETGATEQALGLYAVQADAIKELLDKHAPHTSGNLQTRLAQVFGFCPNCGAAFEDTKCEGHRESVLHGKSGSVSVIFPLHTCLKCEFQWSDYQTEAIRDFAVKEARSGEGAGAPPVRIPRGQPVQLERWGKAEANSDLLLQRRADGYWTPWHVAQAAIDTARSMSPTPEPIGAAPSETVQAEKAYYCNKCGASSDTQLHRRPDGSACGYVGRKRSGGALIKLVSGPSGEVLRMPEPGERCNCERACGKCDGYCARAAVSSEGVRCPETGRCRDCIAPGGTDRETR